jgi:tetratricopeptide (TPR) repeat protein
MKGSATESVGDAAEAAPISAGPGNRWKIAAISAALVALVFVVFGQSVRFGFVYDDGLYITGNPLVEQGLTMRGVIQSLTYVETDYWHPLTWITHMLDYQLYGPAAGGHHLTNVLIHAATAVALFLVLYTLLGALWRCAFIAAGWSIHPLRVESVAWISERKDVLSGLFFVLALGAYVRWVRRPSTSRYWTLALVYALGLMSKNMLVTFPCVMLLLDYWPLRRLAERSAFPSLVKEKVPLFILSALSIGSTFLYSQISGAVQGIPLGERIENAFVSYSIYLRQSLWPARLSANYPLPVHGSGVGLAVGSLAALCVVTFVVWQLRHQRPYLLVGWLWFVGMLVPVIGLVQVADFAHADRYTYLPQIGLWIGVVWLVGDFVGKSRSRQLFVGGAGVILLAALATAAWRQTSSWRDEFTLWTRALEIEPNDPTAQLSLGVALADMGKTDEAIAQYRKALQIKPDFAKAAYNLGLAFEKQGRLDEAIAEYREAIRIAGNHAQIHTSLGYALYRLGRRDEATAEYRRALEIDPKSAEAYYNLGNVLFQERKMDEAISNFREVVRLQPGAAEARGNLGNALAAQGKIDEAIAEYLEALRLKPSHANAHYNLANALLRKGRGEEAIAELREAVKLEAGNPTYENALAFLFATAPRPDLRDGPQALTLAKKANETSGGGDPVFLRTLAAAYAEVGDFANATATARKAIELSDAHSSGSALARQLRRELQLYEAGQRFRSGP